MTDMAELPKTLDSPDCLRPTQRVNILLVDDQPANLLALEAILQDLGHILVQARSGEEALQRLLVGEFAVVLLDVRMPGISGFDTAKLIRADDRSRHTPIIFLTASDIDRSQMEEGYALGAVDLLVKPLLPVVLRAKVRGFVELFQDKQRTKHEADQLRLLVEGAKDYAIFRLDPQANVASWNAGAERIKGYKAEEIVGQHFSRFYPQEAVDRGWPAHELTVAKAEGRFEDEGWRVRKDGTQFWANVVITALYDEAGTFRGFSKITRDLTERKQSEENARRLVEEATARRLAEENARIVQEQKERLHVTLASIGDAVISTDAEGRVDYLNPVAEELVGWTTADATGCNLEDVFHIVNEDTRLPVENPAMRALRDGRIVGLANHTVMISKKGIERPIDDSAAPIRDANSNVIGSVLVFRDVSEQRGAAQASRKNQELLQLIHKIGKIGHWEWNSLTDDNKWSPEIEALYGLPPGGFEGGYQGWAKLLHPDDLPKAEQDVRRAMETGEYFSEFRVIWPDGSVHWLETRAQVFKDNQDKPVRIMGVNMDITERKRVEEERRQSEQRTRIILESITDAFFAVDRDWRFSYVNPQAERLLDRQPGDLLGQVIWDVYPGLIESEFETAYRRVATERISLSLTSYYPDHNRWYEVHVYPASDGGISIYFQDVSERKRAEAEVDRLQEASEQQRRIYETALSNSADFNYVFDLRGRFVYVNKALLALWGKDLNEAVGKDFLELDYPPDLAERLQRQIQTVIDNRQPLTAETPYSSGVGERQYEYIFVPVLGAGGEVEAVAGSTRDITERKRAEESARYLAEASATLAGVVDYESTLQKVANLAVPYFADWSAVDVANDDGSLRRLAVAHQDAAKVRLAHELMQEYPPDPQSPSGSVAVFRTGKPEIVGEITDEMLVQAAKDERHLSLIRMLGLKSYLCVPLVVSGNPLGVLTFATAESGRRYRNADLALATDLAHRAAVAIENTQLYQALREADRRKDEFLATLAHELRNPLAPIRNSLQILKMPRLDAATIERSRDMMERQVHHLVRLVDDLLDVSRVMRGKIELRKERVELSTVIARAVETVQPLIEAQGHELTVHLPPESLSLDADPVRLAQVVGNLLTNAAKYTEANGRIRLTAQREDGEAVLRVRDSGIGIAPDMLPHIFELFVQVDHAATRSQGGLGIGLTLVKNLVEMHHGAVEAHSEGLGEGCEFVVRLPLIPQEYRQRIEEENGGAQREPARSSGHRLLVVDDNRDAADSLAMLLRLQGHEVRVAHDGPAALEMVNGYCPALVFLDIGMPGMDGYEVARRLRQQPGLNNVRLAALTGWGQQEDRRRTAEAGFDHHLVKPVEPKALEGLLADLKRAKG
jgi:PAS domain S-box-containing protein